jgi:glycosyltransferase involved in cell wall biosynthesis
MNNWDAKTPALEPAPRIPGLDRQLTAVIKTFDRPDACRRLIASIREQFPSLPIIVADDGKTPLGEGDYEYLRLPFDVGLSAGRNAAVDRVRTPYLWLFDDDHSLLPNTDLSRAIGLLVDKALDVVGARVWNEHRNKEGMWRGVYEPVGRRLHVHPGVLSHHDGYSRVHLTEMCFLARTEVVSNHPWHAADKIGGCNHWGFFYRLYLAGAAVGIAHDLWVMHDKPPGSTHYRAFRERPEFRPASFERHGFDGELVWTSPREQQPDLPLAPVIRTT